DGVLTVVSKRIKQVMGEQRLIEYLPVSIIDHKGRAASKDYFVVHPISGVDCLDLEKSKPEYNFIDKDCIDEVQHTVIDGVRVPHDVHLFGIHKFRRYLIVEESLKQVLEAVNIQGVQFVPSEDYPNSGREDL